MDNGIGVLEFGTEPFPDDAAVTHVITKHGETGNTGERPHCCGHTHNADNHVSGVSPRFRAQHPPTKVLCEEQHLQDVLVVYCQLNKTFTVRQAPE